MEDNQIFNMFRPEELQKIIVGATVVDWRGIESSAKVKMFLSGPFLTCFSITMATRPVIRQSKSFGLHSTN